MKRASDYKVRPTEAHAFHESAYDFLTQMGFVLTNAPNHFIGPHQASVATYRSSAGLALSVGFEMGDSNSGAFSCGREWYHREQLWCLSNHYSILARKFGIDLPLTYRLGYGEQRDQVLKTMLNDLKQTLPIVVSRVTLHDLISIEDEEFGAERRARTHFGSEYLQFVQISTLTSNAPTSADLT